MLEDGTDACVVVGLCCSAALVAVRTSTLVEGRARPGKGATKKRGVPDLF